MTATLARWTLDGDDAEAEALASAGVARPMRVVWCAGYADLLEAVDETGRVRAAFTVSNSSAVFIASGMRLRAKGARGASGTIEAA